MPWQEIFFASEVYLYLYEGIVERGYDEAFLIVDHEMKMCGRYCVNEILVTQYILC